MPATSVSSRSSPPTPPWPSFSSRTCAPSCSASAIAAIAPCNLKPASSAASSISRPTPSASAPRASRSSMTTSPASSLPTPKAKAPSSSSHSATPPITNPRVIGSEAVRRYPRIICPPHKELSMKRVFNLFPTLAVRGLLFFFASFSAAAYADTADKTFVSRTAEIDGVKLHYTTGGHGPALILLHGYAETYVDTHPSSARREIYGDGAGPARDGGLGDPRERYGHEDCRDPHSCARPLARRSESQCSGARHRLDGCLCLRRAVPCGSGETGGDGCVSSRRG